MGGQIRQATLPSMGATVSIKGWQLCYMYTGWPIKKIGTMCFFLIREIPNE